MLVVSDESSQWRVYSYDVNLPLCDLAETVSAFAPDLASWIKARDGRGGQRFLIGPNGHPDLRINACLGSAKWRNLDEDTYRCYVYSLGVWLNFLLAHGVQWWEATEDDAEEFLFWRVTDPRNESTVQTNSFARDLAALKKFYKWAGPRYGIVNPFSELDPPVAVRSQKVRWLDPGGYERWRDLGIRGMGLDGRPDRWWRGRNDQRDTAFCDGLYGTGLRVAEWASVVMPELPAYDARRGYFTCELADYCAKGGYGHRFWVPRSAIKGVLAYIEGARAAAVRRAQATGRYDRVQERRLVLATRGREKATIENARGVAITKSWNEVGPRVRLRLYRETPQGLEPVALWLNEDGLPRDGRGWQHTFEVANARIAGLALESFECTAHMLRHSMALKWYSVGKLVQAARLGHLSVEQQEDFRDQFGDAWHLVQTLLGHRRVETTKEVYLEPFRKLDVEILLAHADGFPIEALMADAFADHPRVRTDPLAA